MRERLRIFFSLTVFWLSFMIAARVIFLAYNFRFSCELTAKEIGLSMLHGLRMDVSISGYFLLATGLLLVASSFKSNLVVYKIAYGLTVGLILFCTVIIGVDMELYRHWGFRMNTTPLMYIGSEAMGSISFWVYVRVILIQIVIAVVAVSILQRKVFPYIKYLDPPRRPGRTALILFLISALLFIPIRGSFTVAPMNTGFVYFHNTKTFPNHAAINVVWNFLYSLRKTASHDYPTNFFPAEQTNTLFDSLYQYSDSTIRITSSERPNVLLIILESFTAGVIEPLGGVKDLTPNLNALCKEGVLFTNIYSSGDRTDKGLISILSGFPAQPQTSVIKSPAKTQRLKQLNRYMRDLGYRTSFIYGGDIDFANFRSYLNTSGFDHLTTLDDFDQALYTSKWGVHDQFMFDQAMMELDTTKGQFFKVLLTLSSHEPFDVPMKEPYIKGSDEESLFLNSCHYTDQCLGRFMDYCKSQSWWQNTLVVITADHGHRHPGNKKLNEKERFHIPLLITGGAVVKDTVVTTLGSQTDIPNTLLGQIGVSSRDFNFSKNLLSRSVNPFAAYFFNDGYGFLLPDKYIIYDNPGKQFLRQDGATPSDLDLSKAYQQKLFTNYNMLDK